MNRLTAVAVAVSGALALPVANAQQQPPTRAGTVAADVTVVLVDVVVRDRRGEPVRDLTQADFEVAEDGLPQTIASFTPVAHGTPAPIAEPRGSTARDGPAATLPPAPPAASTAGVTALVFDHLSVEGRRLAVQAAQTYVGSHQEVPDYIAVFDIDSALTSYSPFTRSGYALRQALAKLATRASIATANRDQQDRRAGADRRAETAAATAAAARGIAGPGAGAAMGTAPAEELMARMEAGMLEDFERLDREQQGYASTNGLFAIINRLGNLPGRKSLVLFSEGVAIPPAVQRLFLGVIDAANRANVSIYAMDAAGLRAESEQAKIRDEVNRSATAGIDTGYSPTGRNEGPLTRSLEKNEDVLRQDPHASLGMLAEGTGGLLFDSTNDLKRGFDRIEGDLRNYYLVGYTPKNAAFDGRFRTIEVRVRRPGVTVSARRGYFAVRDAGGGPINAWEAPALGALESKPIANAFPIRAAALVFPERDRPGLVPVVVDFRTAPLTFQLAADGKTYASEFAVVVRFLDERNRVVRKVSQHYEVNGPAAALERARQGEVVFYREPELPAGVFTMEAIVYDAPSQKASARVSTVEVQPHTPDTLRLSSLLVIRSAEKVGANDSREDNPLLVDGVVLRPNLGEAVSKASKEVGFYFAVYPGRDGAPVASTLELLQNGAAVATLPLPSGAADATGRIQQIGRLPLDRIPAGTYELRAIVKQGGRQLARSAPLRITE